VLLVFSGPLWRGKRTRAGDVSFANQLQGNSTASSRDLLPSGLGPAPFIQKAFICLNIGGEYEPGLREVGPYLSGFSVVSRLCQAHTLKRALAAITRISLPIKLPMPMSVLLARTL
jgi:hypothetical protein